MSASSPDTLHLTRRVATGAAPGGRRARTLYAVGAAALLLLAGCATGFDNQPLNQPITEAFVRQAGVQRDIVGSNVIGLSLSGGGIRAAAFGLGVMQALDGVNPAGPDGVALSPAQGAGTSVYNDISFISSVSGGSLTAAFVALHGREALAGMRDRVLVRNLERDLRSNLWSPTNWVRLLSGGLNDRSNLARALDEEVFAGATFADLARRNKPDVWINATDLYNRTPFPFTPQAFLTLCSDLSALRVSEAVAASMAVPLVFAPVVLRTYPDHCLTPLPPRVEALLDDPTRVATDTAASTARAMRNYRDATRMRYLKLADGGLTDNQGLSSILIARTMGGTPYGPLTAVDAVRIRRMLFLIVDAGRPPAGDWALRLDGPSGVEVGIASADAAIDSATRQSAVAFRAMANEWRDSLVRYRCGLSEAQARPHLTDQEPWRCDDVTFYVGTVSAEALPAEQARRLREMPTRLALPAEDVDAAIAAGRAATLANPALKAYLADRLR